MLKIPRIITSILTGLAALTIAIAGSPAESPLEGKWQLLAPAHGLLLSLDISGQVENLGMTVELLAEEATMLGFPAETRSLNLTEVAFDGSKLEWTIPFPAKPARCGVVYSETLPLDGECRRGEDRIDIQLKRPGKAAALVVEEVSEDRQPYLEALRAVVLALSKRDYTSFESLFSSPTKGLQPNELWKGASMVSLKFGEAEWVGFSEFDGEGAFVKVRFERAEREFYVQLADNGKIRELTYVPPPGDHE